MSKLKKTRAAFEQLYARRPDMIKRFREAGEGYPWQH